MRGIYIDFGDSLHDGGEVFANCTHVDGVLAYTDKGVFDLSDAVYWDFLTG